MAKIDKIYNSKWQEKLFCRFSLPTFNLLPTLMLPYYFLYLISLYISVYFPFLILMKSHIFVFMHSIEICMCLPIVGSWLSDKYIYTCIYLHTYWYWSITICRVLIKTRCDVFKQWVLRGRGGGYQIITIIQNAWQTRKVFYIFEKESRTYVNVVVDVYC